MLDVGCGTGALLAAIAQTSSPGRLVGVDVSPGMLAVARAKLAGRAALVVADAARLPFADRSFDVAVSTSSLHFWPEPGRALAEIARVLAPAGRLALTDWCRGALALRLLDRALRVLSPVHQRVHDEAEIEGLLGEAGFTGIAFDRYRIGWPWRLVTARAERTR